MVENNHHFPFKIGIAGSGRMASYLLSAFEKSAIRISVIFSRNSSSMQQMVLKNQVPNYTQIEQIKHEVDIWFLAVPDDAIYSIAQQLHTKYPGALFVHCSGAFETSKLNIFHSHSACFYPLQTLSGGLPPNYQSIPILISATDTTHVKLLSDLANRISTKVLVIEEADRLVVHLAAVFANNFTNLMIRMSQDILSANGLSLSLLETLMQETIDKIKRIGPNDAQTGPALRGDLHTITKHRAWLDINKPELSEIYNICTKEIVKKSQSL
jgi:predicted short-subunit dehydrogenase-like oxidoreductase (DUF2520 family)